MGLSTRARGSKAIGSISGQLRLIETAGHFKGLEPFVKKFKAAGAFIIHKCVTVRHAKSAERLGVDMISMDGFDCAGHPGEADIGNWVLFPKAARELKIPFVASGGCGDGKQLAATTYPTHALTRQRLFVACRATCSMNDYRPDLGHCSAWRGVAKAWRSPATSKA